jgi:myosin heavy subunit
LTPKPRPWAFPQNNFLNQPRFLEDETFTYCGETLISLNPFYKFQADYNSSKKLQYFTSAKQSLFIQSYLQPHIYSIIAESLNEFYLNNTEEDYSKNNSILLSGESGSGKSILFQLIVEFLTFCLSKNCQNEISEAKSEIWPADLRERSLAELAAVNNWKEWSEGDGKNEGSDVRWDGVKGDHD